MADCTRKRLVGDIQRDLITLPSDELFHIAKVIEAVQGKDSSELDLEDSEGCFKYICAFMSSESLFETEDQGMSILLSLQETVKTAKQICITVCTSDVDTNTHPTHVSPPTTDEQTLTTNGTYLTQPCEFKVPGGQIGDHSSDITYNNVCRQIDSGLK